MYWEDHENQKVHLHREKMRKTRKEYKCCECRGKIEISEPYWYIDGKWDHSFGYQRFCLGCYIDWDLIVDIYDKNGEFACVIYGMLADAVEEAFLFNWIQEDNSFIRKWLPDDYYNGEEKI